MITEPQAAIQFARLRSIVGYPVGMEKLHIEALARSSETIQHAARIVSRLVETIRRNRDGFVQFPLPGEILELAGSVAPCELVAIDDEHPRPPCNCNQGWIISERQVRDITGRVTTVSCPRCRPKPEAV